jgi:hypothetical protein
MPEYTVPINGENGPGFMTVNASSPEAAMENASQGGNYATGGAVEGGHQAHTGSGGTAVAGYPAGYDAAGQIAGRTTSTQGAQQLGAGIEKLLQAIADGNKAAFDQAVKEFDLTFGLEKDKFGEDIRRFNVNFGEAVRQFGLNYALAESGVTGVFGGKPTLAAQNQAFTQQFGLLQAAQTAQANPFRQAQLYGQANRILAGQPVPGFQAPNIVPGVGTAGGNLQGGMGYLQQIIDDIRNPTPNQTSADQFLAQTPTPNKLDSVSFAQAAPTAQNLILQAMQEKYGIDPNDALKQIQNTLPQFQAPAMGVIRR